MDKCFAYHEEWRGSIRTCGCDILNYGAFRDVQRKRGGCCMNNCAFYKESADQIRSDIGLHPMSREQKKTRDIYRK